MDRLIGKNRRWALRFTPLFLLLSSIALFLLLYFSVNGDVGSDPKLTLVVTQVFLETGKVYLDPYQDVLLLGQTFRDYVAEARIYESEGHYFNYFPAGPSLIASPAVWLAGLFGADMLTEDNYTLQKVLAGLSVIAVYLVLFRIARYYLADGPSLLIATVSVFGSSLLSTLGGAFWSLNLSTLFITLALWVLAREETTGRMRPYLFGLLLFLAYFSRPTAAAFIAPAMVYLLWRSRRYFVRSALVALFLVGLYHTWSYQTYGYFFSDYYSPSRIFIPRTPAYVALLGNLVSPSRGLFIFSPFLILVLVGLIAGWGRLWRLPLLWMCLVWISLHFALIVRGVIWWGGSSFGPRLLADVFPAFVLLAIYAWRANIPALSPPARRTAVGAFTLLGVLSILINAGQGLYNQAAAQWNLLVDPDPGAGWGDMFDWRYAQPLATQRMLCALQEQKYGLGTQRERTLAPLSPWEPINYWGDSYVPFDWPAQSPVTPAAETNPAGAGLAAAVYLPLLHLHANQALFVGWSDSTDDFRWSVCPLSRLFFIPATPAGDETSVSLTIVAWSLGPQVAELTLNGSEIGALEWSRAPWDGPPEGRTLTFDSRLLRQGEINDLSFHFPDAKRPAPEISLAGMVWDQRSLAIAFESMTISYRDTMGAPATPTLPEGYP